MSLNISIIDHYSQIPGEPGNNRFLYLANLLVDKGHNVEIITTTFAHKTKRQRSINDNEINTLSYKFIFLPEPGYSKNISVFRLWSHFIFGINLYKQLNHIKDKIDILYVAIPSLSVGFFSAIIAKKKNIPLIIDIQDIWPEAFKMIFNPPILGDILYFPIHKIANFIYKSANSIVAVSKTYLSIAKLQNKKSSDFESVYLGTDMEMFKKIQSGNKVIKNDKEFWIIYIGTLGHSYDLRIIMDSLSILKNKGYKNIIFKILGDGPRENKFRTYANKIQIKKEFLGRLPYNEMIAYLTVSDVAVNPILKGAAQSIINKVGDYAAAGLPVINTQECPEYRDLVENFKFGFNCDNSDAEDIASKIELLYLNNELRIEMGKNHLEIAEKLFNRNITYQTIVNLIEKYDH